MPRAYSSYCYDRHRPEQTPLYEIVETHYPKFLARFEAEGGSLPAFVQQEFDDYLKCGLYLDFEPGAALHQLIGASIHYRIAIGPNAGKKALPLRTVSGS